MRCVVVRLCSRAFLIVHFSHRPNSTVHALFVYCMQFAHFSSCRASEGKKKHSVEGGIERNEAQPFSDRMSSRYKCCQIDAKAQIYGCWMPAATPHEIWWWFLASPFLIPMCALWIHIQSGRQMNRAHIRWIENELVNQREAKPKWHEPQNEKLNVCIPIVIQFNLVSIGRSIIGMRLNMRANGLLGRVFSSAGFQNVMNENSHPFRAGSGYRILNTYCWLVSLSETLFHILQDAVCSLVCIFLLEKKKKKTENWQTGNAYFEKMRKWADKRFYLFS